MVYLLGVGLKLSFCLPSGRAFAEKGLGGLFVDGSVGVSSVDVGCRDVKDFA